MDSVPKWRLRGRVNDESGQTESRQYRVCSSSFAKVGRNDPCPCGSGLKYKKCHGKNQ